MTAGSGRSADGAADRDGCGSPPPADRRLRRARSLVCYWDHDGRLLAHPYPDAEPVVLPHGATQVLAAFEDWTTPAQAAAALPGHVRATAPRIIEHLAAGHALLSEGSPRARRDAALSGHWAPWAPQAPFLHYTTQTSPAPPEPEAAACRALPAQPGTGLFTTHPQAPCLPLPRLPMDLTAPFGTVLYTRRTHYHFTDTPVPSVTLAGLLATVFGPVDYLDAGPAGTLYRRTSPNAGARQELDAYLAVRNVEHIDPGWYHYHPGHHVLEQLAQGCTAEELTALCHGQQHAGTAAFLLILVATTQRQLTHHATPRSYRVLLLNAGHLSQTFALTATALRLGPFQIAACDDRALAARLGLDDITNTPLHVLGAGLPDPDAPTPPPPRPTRA